jgi:uncharacterized protein YqgQ
MTNLELVQETLKKYGIMNYIHIQIEYTGALEKERNITKNG